MRDGYFWVLLTEDSKVNAMIPIDFGQRSVKLRELALTGTFDQRRVVAKFK